jgi:hypothetical protein
MMNIYDIRRENLRIVITLRFGGSQTRFARMAGIAQPSFVSRLLSGNTKTEKHIGDRLARKIETNIGLAPQALDYPPSRSYHDHYCPLCGAVRVAAEPRPFT